MPVLKPAVATTVLLLVQVPPDTDAESVLLVFAQMVVVPLIVWAFAIVWQPNKKTIKNKIDFDNRLQIGAWSTQLFANE